MRLDNELHIQYKSRMGENWSYKSARWDIEMAVVGRGGGEDSLFDG